jgi:hypothetical protein
MRRTMSAFGGKADIGRTPIRNSRATTSHQEDEAAARPRMARTVSYLELRSFRCLAVAILEIRAKLARAFV